MSADGSKTYGSSTVGPILGNQWWVTHFLNRNCFSFFFFVMLCLGCVTVRRAPCLQEQVHDNDHTAQHRQPGILDRDTPSLSTHFNLVTQAILYITLSAAASIYMDVISMMPTANVQVPISPLFSVSVVRFGYFSGCCCCEMKHWGDDLGGSSVSDGLVGHASEDATGFHAFPR